jgi:hypothetical protein
MEWMPENPYPDAHYPGCQNEVFEDGCQQTARKIVEWLYTQCPNNKHRSHRERSRLRLDCLETMEQLRKEVKEGE